jgi:hypothetical protein
MTRNPITRLAHTLGYAATLVNHLIVAQLLDGVMQAAASDWIPSTDAAKATFAATFAAGITADPGSYGLVAGDATAFTILTAAYTAALDVATNDATRTPATIAAKDAAKNAMIPELRRLGNLIQANPAVSDADKVAIGLTVRDTGPGSQTPVPAPSTFPLLNILSATPFNHNLKVTDSDTPTTNAKPPGAIALEFRAQVSATPIADPEDIEYAGLETSHLVNFQFQAGDVGKQVYYAGRWITRTGLVGPWSDVLSFTAAA